MVCRSACEARRIRWKLWSVVIMVGFTACPVTASAASAPDKTETYPVGVAAIDITPDHPIRLNGFGFRRDESDGVRQRIWAKALAIGSDEQGPAVLITVDILGIPDGLATALAERLAARSAVHRERLAITATHTHSAPLLRGENTTIFGVPIPEDHLQHIDRYTRVFEAKLEQVVLDALADRKPATLHWGVGTVGFAQNRRTAGGPVDHDLPLLAIRSPGGTLRAVYVSYACHCVTLSDNKVSGDWAGFAQEAIQRDFPGAVALCSVGCGADSNPSSGVTGDRVDVAAAQGEEIASEVRRLLESKLAPIHGVLRTHFDRVELPLQPLPTRAGWEELARLENATGHHARTQLAKLDRGETLIENIDAPVQSWRFGDSLAVVFLPGETVVDYSLRLKREFDASRLWVNGYSNAAPGYVPSDRILTEGGYEGGGAMIYYDIPQAYAPGLEQKIIDTVKAQLGDRIGLREVADPREIAAQLLNDELTVQEREALVAAHPDLAVGLIAAMTDHLPPGPEEYRRIPWIWRVAIAAGRRNDEQQLRGLLYVALPGRGGTLRHWQAVVIGGGIINGISQQYVWPLERIDELLRHDVVLKGRWRWIQIQASKMADDEQVPFGTRYDALRILGCSAWESHGAQLRKYLAEGTHDELQMGAVSGLVDVQSPQSTEALVGALKYLKGTNRELALDGLLRDVERAGALLDAAARQEVTVDDLGVRRVQALREHPDGEVRRRAGEMFVE